MAAERFQIFLVRRTEPRAVEKTRLVKRLGKLEAETAAAVLEKFGELFAP